MGLDTELDFEKYCQVVEIPKLGRLSHHHSSKAEERNEKGKPAARSSLSSLSGNFTEISFTKSLSSSCKSMSTRPSMLSDNEAFKRGSVYQSSREVRRLKTMGTFEVREKIELSYRSETSPSFRIINSLSQPDNGANPLVEKKSTLMSCNGDSNPKSITFIEPDTSLSLHSAPRSVTSLATGDVSSDGFFEIRMDSEDREQCAVAETIVRGSTEQTKFRCYQTMGPQNDGNGSLERDTVFRLHKSSSEKLGMHYSPCRAGSDQYSKASTKPRFSHFRRMLDPFMKSKSLRSPSVSVPHTSGEATTIKRSKTLCTSLLNDFSSTTYEMESGAQFVEPDHSLGLVSSSPAHLHGQLRLELKHGVPFFEFSLKDPEDCLTAKTWRADSAFNWVYTFHSMNRRKRSNRSPWGAKERQKDDLMVGQMQVSSYLCSELRENGALDNSMMTEFVLCDVTHASKSFHGQESSECSTDSTKPAAKGTSCESLVVGDLPLQSKDVPNDPVNQKLEFRHPYGNNDDSGATMSYPWALADLHPNLEITGIVIQVPFEKRESLKGDKQEDKIGVNYSPNLLDFSGVNQRSDDIPVPGRRRSFANVKVVIPSGTHGLPTTEEGGGGGPSPLLDRWRSSGGCDCGGWDMACPLLVLDSPSVQNMAGGHLLMENKRPLELFVQGDKEKIPALTIKAIGDGQYSVDFHARLSKLQAFSICVAILHSSEVSTVVRQEKEKQRLQCNSLKVLLEEEVRFLIEAVAEGEKRKLTKKIEENPPSFVLNPPFSPIARV